MSKRVPTTPRQLDEAKQTQQEITKQVDDKPFEYPDAHKSEEAIHQTESRQYKPREDFPTMGKPKWFKELKDLMKGFGRPTRKRGKRVMTLKV